MTVVILGLDGFHENLLEFTPKINSLYQTYSSGRLKSTTPPVTAPAWASFQTGMNQGRHGVFDFVEYDDQLEMSVLDGRSLRAQPFYEYLAEEGQKCYLQNLPFALPARIEGDIMPSWLDSDDTDPYPPDLCDRYDVERPSYPELDGGVLENIRKMHRSFDHNTDIFERIFSAEDHDLYFHLISVTDWLQHEVYQDLQERQKTDATDAAEELLLAVDNYVDRILNLCDEGIDVLLLSDHGFKMFDGAFFVNDWLLENGLLKQSSEGHRFTTKDETDSVVIQTDRFGQWIRSSRIWPLLRPMKNTLENVTNIGFTAEQGIDLELTLAYCRSKDEGSIRFNENHPDFNGQTIEDVHSQLQRENGVDAHLTSDIYEGPYTSETGEIVLTGNSHVVQRGPIGTVQDNTSRAHHSMDGMVIGIGSSFKGSPSDARLIDIAPTLVHLMGHRVPENMDGTVLEGMLSADQTIKYSPSDEYDPSFSTEDSNDNDVEDRLNSLGYL